MSDPEIGGEIGYHKLSGWWLSTFSEAEPKHIEKTAGPITEKIIGWTSQTPAQLLYGVSSSIQRIEDLSIALRLLAKAEQLAESDVLDLHYCYMTRIQLHYRHRNANPKALDEAIAACEKQIALAPKSALAFKKWLPNEPLVAHTGFYQLAVIRDKQGNYEEAIRISRLAMEQGWAGDWEKRIARYKKKLSKARP